MIKICEIDLSTNVIELNSVCISIVLESDYRWIIGCRDLYAINKPLLF